MVFIAAPLADSGGGAGIGLLIPIILIVGMIWFMTRSQRRARQRQEATVAALNPGVRVLTTSGLVGTVSAIEDEFIVLEVAPGVEMRFVRQAIGRVLDDPETAFGDPTDTDLADVDDVIDDETVQDRPTDKPKTPPTHTEN
jgi:preprotein translocase subunit YajC